LDVACVAVRHLGARLATGRIEHLAPAARGRIGGLSVDPVGQAHPQSLSRGACRGRQIDCMRPPSTARLTPLTYAAAGVHRKAIAAATSAGLAKRPAGTVLRIASATASSDCPVASARSRRICAMRPVSVYPGSTLLTVIPQG